MRKRMLALGVGTTILAGSLLTSVSLAGAEVRSFAAQDHGSSDQDDIVAIESAPGGGYWELAGDGSVFSHYAPFHGAATGVGDAVDMARSSTGYWIAAADGNVYPFDSPDLGSLHGTARSPIVGIASTPDGDGYWLAAADGGVFAFGTARFRGSMGNRHLNEPIVDIGAARDGSGYRLVAGDGGIFTFGTTFSGSAVGLVNQPAVAMGSTNGHGYWIATADGGIFTFGVAVFSGALNPTDRRVVALTEDLDGVGYHLVAETTASASSAATPDVSPTSTGGGIPAVLARIRGCESGGRYNAQNPRSTASGAYQFLDSTWHGYGGYRRAMYAPPAVQDAAALALYARAGTSPWNASRGCWG